MWKVGNIVKDETMKMSVTLKTKNEEILKNGTFVACLKF